jgi:hypothetical protein
MSRKEYCDKCKKLQMVALEDVTEALYFASQWCKCPPDIAPISNNSRDTQFAGFAKLLTDELIKYLTSREGLTLDEIEQEWHKVIACRAYDFARHIMNITTEEMACVLFIDDAMKEIPDMIKWPREEEG